MIEAEVCGPAEPCLLSAFPSLQHPKNSRSAVLTLEKLAHPLYLRDSGFGTEGFGVLPGQQQHMNAERQE